MDLFAGGLKSSITLSFSSSLSIESSGMSSKSLKSSLSNKS
jgi:hypothetical protein